MALRVTSIIDNLDEKTADKLRAGERYEVVLDYLDGDHRELELHFRLVELTATRKLEPSGVHYAGGLEGAGPHMPLPPRKPELNMGSLADLLAAIITLSKISPQVLGVPAGDGLLADRIYRHLSGDDAG